MTKTLPEIKKTRANSALKGGVCVRHKFFGCSKSHRTINGAVFLRLPDIRQEIDEIDKEIIELLAKRKACAEEVREYKKKNNLPLIDKKREDEIIAQRIQQSKSLGLNSPDFIKKIFNNIFEESKNIQREIINET